MTPWTAACQTPLSFSISWTLLKLMSIQSVMPSNHLILCCPFNLLSSNFPSIRIFSSESALRIRWPKFWSFIFSISHSNEKSRPIFFRTEWIVLLYYPFYSILTHLQKCCLPYTQIINCIINFSFVGNHIWHNNLISFEEKLLIICYIHVETR